MYRRQLSPTPNSNYKNKNSLVGLVTIFFLILAKNWTYHTYPPLIDNFKVILSLSNDQIHEMTAIPATLNTFCGILGGILSDFQGIRVTSVLAMFIIMISQIIFTLGCSLKSYAVLLTGRILFGLANQSIYVLAASIGVNWFPQKNRGKVMGFIFGSDFATYLLCYLLVPIIFADNKNPAITSSYGIVIAFVSLLITLFFFLFDKASQVMTEEEESLNNSQPKGLGFTREDLTDLRRLEYLIILILFGLVTAPTVQFVLRELRVVLVDRCSQPNDVWIGLMEIYIIMSMLLSIIVGFVTDWMGKRGLIITIASVIALIVYIVNFFYIKTTLQSCEYKGYYLILLAVGTLSGMMYSCCADSIHLLIRKNILGLAYGILFSVFAAVEKFGNVMIDEFVLGVKPGDQYSNIQTINAIFVGMGCFAVVCAVVLFTKDKKNNLDNKLSSTSSSFLL